MTTFADLKLYARQRTNTVNSNAPDDAAVGAFLNRSLGAFWSIITTTYEDYAMNRYLASITAGNQLPVPPDFYKLRAVDFGGPGQWTTVFGYNLQSRNRNNNPIAIMSAPFGNYAGRKVRVMGNAIYVEPEQLAAGQYQVWYTPKYKWLVADTDTIDPAQDIDGMSEYAIAATGMKIYNALNLSTAGFVEEMNYYSALAIDSLSSRMANGAECVENVTNLTDWGSVGMGGYGGLGR